MPVFEIFIIMRENYIDPQQQYAQANNNRERVKYVIWKQNITLKLVTI